MKTGPDPALWQRLSPQLDELLELAPPARAARLAALRLEDAPLAEALAEMLDRLPALEAERFLDAPVLPRPAGLAGQTVGAYLLQREIGQGGMGSVWLAQRADGRYEGFAAIKFMRGGLVSPAATERFLREGQLLARLDHPHIARLLDAGVRPPQGGAAGQPYLVLEYVEGQPIDRHCEARGLSDRARVRLVLSVAAAVAHAHSRLILHRDLKPSNILVTADGQPKLLDFGIGKLLADADAEAGAGVAGPDAAADRTQFTQLAFTARCAAPEQLQQQDLTTATDVYALGVLLYGLLGGGHPTNPEGGGSVDQLHAVVHTVPARLSDAVRRTGGAQAARRARALQGDMDTILARALRKDPAERYANAADLAEDLRRWLDHEPVLARRDTAAYRIARFVRRHARAVVAAGSAGALALGGGAAVALWQAHEARHQRSQAEGLVEFMLRDLQPRLNQIGRPELLQAVGERAQAYYGDEDLRSMDSEALARRARALRVLGESARQRLDKAQAQRAFDQAADTTGRLLALAPNDIERLREHASSLERLVELQDSSTDKRAPLALARQISSLRRQAAALAPQDPVLRLQAVDGDHWLASALTTTPREAELMPLLDQADATLATLPAGLDGLERVRRINQALRGQTLGRLGRYAEAEAALQAYFAEPPSGPQAPASIWHRGEDRLLRRELTFILLNQGKLVEAVAQVRLLEASMDADAPLNRVNRVIAADMIYSRAFIGQVLWLCGAREQARGQLRAIDDLLAKVGEVSPDQGAWHVHTMGLVLALRLLLAPPAAGADAAMLAALQTHADHVAEAERRGHQLGAVVMALSLNLELAHGDALAARGETGPARQRWQTVAARALAPAQAGGHRAMYHLAQALLRLNQPQEAARWGERLQAEGWRHPDLALLRQRLTSTDVGKRTALAS